LQVKKKGDFDGGLGTSERSNKISLPLVAKPAKREWKEGDSSQLDPRFEHVYAVLFLSKEVLWERGDRTPKKLMPRYKAIVNSKTKMAFWM
jgi:hypothetical protein